MAKPFSELAEHSVAREHPQLKTAIEEAFADLETRFARLANSDRRLKALPGMEMPSISAPYEFLAIQVLRGLKLAEAAAILIEAVNWAAVFPVLRSLFETWVAVKYADLTFRRLVIDGAKWKRYDEVALRMLRGRSPTEETRADAKAKVIPIGSMLAEVKNRVGEQGAALLTNAYADLSDGTHPTIWSVAFHLERRPDGLGTIIHREPQLGGLEGPLSDLSASLRSLAAAAARFEKTAYEIWEAFRTGPWDQ